jgi:gas vesicle protein
LVIGTLVGTAIGGLTALWFAPQSGKQLQTLVRKQGKALKQQADEVTAHVYEQIEDGATQATEQVKVLRQESEQFLNDQVDLLNQAAVSVKKSVSA